MTTRRTFLIAGGGAAVAGGAVLAYVGSRPDPSRPDPTIATNRVEPRAPAAPLGFAPFDARAELVLARMYDDLIPGDEGLPSASEAGVMNYVTTMARSAGFTSVRNRLVKLSRWLDLEAERRFGADFAALPDEGRRQILEAAAHGEGRRRSFNPAASLRLATRVGLEGYLGHPHHRNAEPFTVWEQLDIRMARNPAESHS